MSVISMELPIKAPKLISCKSIVMTCASCKRWYARFPEFMDNDSFDECWYCQNTSFDVREGRVYSRKSKDWAGIVKTFEELWYMIPDWDESIVCEPPLSQIDRRPLRDWFEAQNMYGCVWVRSDEDED
jgi:hypothetical protein